MSKKCKIGVLGHPLLCTSIGDHEVMVIGGGENVDESLVEVVQAVVEVCILQMCVGFKNLEGVSTVRSVLPQHGHGNAPSSTPSCTSLFANPSQNGGQGAL